MADGVRQVLSLGALAVPAAPGPLRVRRRRLPLVAEAEGGGFVVLAGHARVEAARAAGLASVEAVVVGRLPPAFADLARRLAAGDVPPAELAEATERLVREHGARSVAEGLGLSAPHVRNLARLRRALAPEAWAAFAAEGPRASLRWWLTLAALPSPDQLTRLGRRRARPRRRSNR
ncbi:MAG TPA: ParB/RepB/Spo0J family partition protein, partial [Polyangiaceae bacterium]|nr:ParB/RepB/Spo0J family partition protein [Polyangiaceae bacterium]